MNILGIDFDKISLHDDSNCYKHDSDTFLCVRLWLGVINLKNAKHL